MIDNVGRSDFESELKPLWLRAQAGDETAYRECLTRMAAQLRAFLRRRMWNLPDEVEDLVQDTLIAIHTHRSTYDPTLPVSAWLMAIARHKLVDLFRRRGRHDALNDSLDSVDESLLAADTREGTAHRDLEQLLQTLPKAQREAIQLTKVEGLSVAEAAQRSGASPSAIKVQVHRGLRRLALLVKA